MIRYILFCTDDSGSPISCPSGLFAADSSNFTLASLPDLKNIFLSRIGDNLYDYSFVNDYSFNFSSFLSHIFSDLIVFFLFYTFVFLFICLYPSSR